MEAPAGIGEAVLGAVAFANERFLRDEAWHDRIDEVLGASAPLRPCLARTSSRTPVVPTDGCGWTCGVEWDARRRRDDLRGSREPPAPVRARLLPLDRGARATGEVLAGPSASFPDCERRVLAAEGVGSVLAVPVFVGPDWWGFLGFDDCTDERVVVRRGDRTRCAPRRARWASRSSGSGPRRRRRFTEQQYRSIVEHIPAITYIDAVNEQAPSDLRQPADRGAARVLASRSGSPTPTCGRGLLHPDDRARALAENARHNETGEPFSLEYRMFAKDGRVVWVLDQAIAGARRARTCRSSPTA